VECVAGGHQPVTSGAQQQPVQRTSLSCTTVTCEPQLLALKLLRLVMHNSNLHNYVDMR